MRVLFPTGPNHLSQGVRHCAEGCAPLEWNSASVMNNPLRKQNSSPLYLCLPSIWGAVGGDHLNSHYSWDRYGNEAEKTSPQNLKKRGTPLQGQLYAKFFSSGLEAPMRR
jgi:hypothetical protein